MAELTNNERILGMIGLARRAGKLVMGTDAVIQTVQSKKPPFLVVAVSDASDRTKKQITDKCTFHGVRLIILDESGDTLAHFAGKKETALSAVCICDRGMAEKIISLWENNK